MNLSWSLKQLLQAKTIFVEELDAMRFESVA